VKKHHEAVAHESPKKVNV